MKHNTKFGALYESTKRSFIKENKKGDLKTLIASLKSDNPEFCDDHFSLVSDYLDTIKAKASNLASEGKTYDDLEDWLFDNEEWESIDEAISEFVSSDEDEEYSNPEHDVSDCVIAAAEQQFK